MGPRRRRCQRSLTSSRQAQCQSERCSRRHRLHMGECIRHPSSPTITSSPYFTPHSLRQPIFIYLFSPSMTRPLPCTFLGQGYLPFALHQLSFHKSHLKRRFHNANPPPDRSATRSSSHPSTILSQPSTFSSDRPVWPSFIGFGTLERGILCQPRCRVRYTPNERVGQGRLYDSRSLVMHS